MTTTKRDTEQIAVEVYAGDMYPRLSTFVDSDGRTIALRTFYDASAIHKSSALLFILPFDLGASTKKGYLKSAPQAETDSTTFTAMCKSIDQALLKGAVVCFFILPETLFPYDSQRYVENFQRKAELTQTELSSRLTYRDNVIGYRYLVDAEMRLAPTFLETEIRATVNELRPFFSHFGAADMTVIRKDFEGISVLASSARGEEPVAVQWKRGRGSLMLIPFRRPESHLDFRDELASLVKCLFTLQSKTLAEEPAWVQSGFLWAGEEQVRRQREEALEALTNLKTKMMEFAQLREILWTRDDTLRYAVTRALRQGGLEVSDDEDYKEDFWLLNEGERSAIGEVKGINDNLSPADMAKVVSHRKAASLKDAFPAVMIANTFANTETVTKLRIEPNVCRRAAEDNVLILRTIDLARLIDGTRRNLEGFRMERIGDFLHAGGGWLEVTQDTIFLHKD